MKNRNVETPTKNSRKTLTKRLPALPLLFTCVFGFLSSATWAESESPLQSNLSQADVTETLCKKLETPEQVDALASRINVVDDTDVGALLECAQEQKLFRWKFPAAAYYLGKHYYSQNSEAVHIYTVHDLLNAMQPYASLMVSHPDFDDVIELLKLADTLVSKGARATEADWFPLFESINLQKVSAAKKIALGKYLPRLLDTEQRLEFTYLVFDQCAECSAVFLASGNGEALNSDQYVRVKYTFPEAFKAFIARTPGEEAPAQLTRDQVRHLKAQQYWMSPEDEKVVDHHHNWHEINSILMFMTACKLPTLTEDLTYYDKELPDGEKMQGHPLFMYAQNYCTQLPTASCQSESCTGDSQQAITELRRCVNGENLHPHCQTVTKFLPDSLKAILNREEK